MNQHSASEGSSRREFLQGSAVVASAVAGGLSIAQSAHAAGSDIIKVGMIGCGGRNSGAILQALNADPGTRLVAMCDLFLDRVKNKRELLKKQKPQQVEVDDAHCFDGFDGYKKVIESVDVVTIANAAKFHPLHLMTAIQAGKHVFVEKPHAIDPAGIKVVKAACELAKQKNLCVQSGLQSRHHPAYEETIKRIWDGQIGEVVSIEENFLRAPYVVINRPPGLTEVQWQCSTQYHFNWLSGDDVVQSLVHNMDRATWVLHEETPLKCHGLGGRSSSFAPIYGNVFDHHSVIYEYASGKRVYAFCRTQEKCHNESDSIVLGSKGRAILTSARIIGENPWVYKTDKPEDPYQIEHNKLFAAIRSGQAINAGDYMARSTMTVIMGQISCYTGKEVSWQQINASDFAYAPKPEQCAWDMEPPVKLGADGIYPVYVPGETVLLEPPPRK